MAPLTILIGPQGSGKSVTTKLLYFCCDLLDRQHSFAEQGISFQEFRKSMEKEFCIWFPPMAWGSGRFNITFTAGPFTLRVLRRIVKKSAASEVTITFSAFFQAIYEDLVSAYSQTSSDDADVSRSGISRSIMHAFKVRERIERRLSTEMGDTFISSQVFIPAGRAFFTTIGRLVAGIEQGTNLDPATLRFAKLFAALRDIKSRTWRLHTAQHEERLVASRHEIAGRLFGGEIKFENELEYVQALDGRRVPFSALSSGQQELLPMWLLIDYYAQRTERNVGTELFYIEEPEAHLFPAAQSLLMDLLVTTLATRKRSLILTTHSPYILGKLNTYLKAGELGRQRRSVTAVGQIVPKELWLSPQRVNAYAVSNGELTSLMGADGLIDPSYIDEVSSEIERTFESLLDIQFPETA